jgi:hypothetical protein
MEVVERVYRLRDGVKIAPLIVIVALALYLFRRMNGELEVGARAIPLHAKLSPPSFRSAATAEPGDPRSEKRWRAIFCRTVKTHSEVDFCTLSVRQSSAVDVLTLWRLRKRILLKTGTEVAYPVGAGNPAGCPHGREVHGGVQQLIAGTASGAANRRRRRAMLRTVEDEPPDGVRPLGKRPVINVHTDFIVASKEPRPGTGHSFGISKCPELASAVLSRLRIDGRHSRK